MKFLTKPFVSNVENLRNNIQKALDENYLILEEIDKVIRLYPDAEPVFYNGEMVWKSKLIHPEVNCVYLQKIVNRTYTTSNPHIDSLLYKVLYFDKFKTKVYSSLTTDVVAALVEVERAEGKLSLVEALKICSH